MTGTQLIIRSFDSNRDDIPYELLLLADPSKKMIDDYIGRGHCYLAFIHDELIGEFVLIHTHPQTYEIVNIAVKEEHQGKGIGKQLVLKAIEEARKKNAGSIEIGTGNSSIRQLRLYQNCGFRIIGIDPDFFVRHYSEEIWEDGIQCRDMIRLRIDLLR
ncbi:N-acetyltransferase [Paenibacillus sp. NFR01]|uniref:GNAT family N-acetyltransferase n=1 Tax=Paenibacillus sp. NFR01 TaxID=1566279 RepID=UPI0008B30DB9|nr:GNAT family N-acetyltransferase [Paenibacillus sp. NFR01]SET94108.1 Acetyltransferase (GNAT) family protein [Paenibacillus sp. NFR01]